MKVSIVLLLSFLAFSQAYLHHRQKYDNCYDVPEYDVTVLLPNPNDCETYIQCDHHSPVIKPCPSGLHWSVSTNRCDYPEIAKCNTTISSRKTIQKAEPNCENVSEDELVFFPHQTNCNKYYQCAHHQAIEMECPAGLHWSVSENLCDYPSIAKCQAGVKSEMNKCKNVSEYENVLLPNPKDCSTYFQCVHQQPELMHCPEGLHWSISNNRCDNPLIAKCTESSKMTPRSSKTTRCENVSENENVFLPNLNDCSTYFECVHQQPELMHCPEGLHWSISTNRCEYPEIAKCNTNCKNVSENENVFLPNPKDCTTYFQCVHQQPELMHCPEGLQWSVSTNRCDNPSIAKCIESSKMIPRSSSRTTECENVSEYEDVLLPNPKDCTTYFQCVHQQPELMHCPEGLHWSVSTNRCDNPLIAKCSDSSKMIPRLSSRKTGCENVPETTDVLLPNPQNCGTYIQCVHQKPMVRPCPAGLHFSVQYNRCEWPSAANCTVTNICDGVPESEDVLLPNPGDCGSFIQCVHQQPVVRDCPKGLHWSVRNNRCEWPSTARCGEEINP